jgi:tripartite-type tricarboxylate transporter receptor subunit TctC
LGELCGLALHDNARRCQLGRSPDELQTLLKSEIDKWSAVIKTVGIKIN